MEGHVRKRGDKWYYSFEAASVDGKRKRIERVGGRTKKEAESALRKALTEYEDNGDVARVSNKSYSDYLDFWIDDHASALRPASKIVYSCLINKHIKPAFGNYPISKITAGKLDAGYKAMAASGLSQKTLRSITSLVSSTLDMAVYPYELIKDNPARYIKRLPKCQAKKDTESEVITPEIFEKLIEAFPYGHVIHMFLQIAYNTGCRISEIRALTWDDVDFEKGTLTVNKQLSKRSENLEFCPTKTESSVRTIYLDKGFISLLKDHRKVQFSNQLRYGEYYTKYYTSDNVKILKAAIGTEIPSDVKLVNFICTREDGTVAHYTSITRYYGRLSKSGGENFRFKMHALRHAHATYLIDNGANIKGVQQRLGHSSYVTTASSYLDDTDKTAKDIVATIERIKSAK